MSSFFCHIRRSFILLQSIGCLLFASGCDSSPRLPSGLYATPSTCDLGVVIDLEEISGDFKIVNTSDRTINIRHVKLSCGCADVHLSKEVISPNSFIDVKLIVAVKGKYGPNVFEALVLTDDVDTPVIPLHLSADIAFRKLDGTVVINFGRLAPESRIDHLFTILPGKINAVSVSDIQYSPLFLSPPEVTVAPSTDNQNVVLKVAGIAPSQYGEFSIDMNLTGDGTDWGEAKVLIQGVIQPEIAIPATVAMGFIEPKQSNTISVEITGLEDFFSRYSIENMIVINYIPENLGIKITRSSNQQLEFSLRHSGVKGPFSQFVEMEFVLSNGKKILLSTNVLSRFL
jgi:Protein of unknown function (DUF1573).